MIGHHRKYRNTTRAQVIAKHLVMRGHKITLLITANTRRYGIVESEWDGIRVIEAPDLLWGRLRSGWDPWDLAWRTAYLRKDTRPYDLVHCFETRPTTIYPALYYCNRHHKVFLTDWIDWVGRGGLITVNRPKWYAPLFGGIETYYEEAFRARAAGLTVIASALAQRAIGLGVRPDRICHLPGGTLPDLFLPRSQEECRQKVGLPLGDPIIGYSSSDSHFDLEIVMAALAIVAREYPSVKLLMTGQVKKAVLDLAREHEVEDHLHLAGFLPFEELPWYLGCADLFVMPFPDTIYNRGRWPNKIGDYMCIGRPTISNPYGDVKELFDEYQVGLFADWDPQDFAQKITTVLENPSLASQMGKNARRVAETELRWEVLIQRLEEFYFQILNRKGSCVSYSGKQSEDR
jgi:glycosyltransferase involved in cell wall biosynthesis